MHQDKDEERRQPIEQVKDGGRLNRRDRRKMEKEQQDRMDLENIENQLKKMVVDHQELQNIRKPPNEQGDQQVRRDNQRQKGNYHEANQKYRKRQGEERQRPVRQEKRERRQQRQYVPREARQKIPREERERRPQEDRERKPKEQRKPRQQRQQLSKQQRELLRQKKREQRSFNRQQLQKLNNQGFVIVGNQQSFRNKDRRQRREYKNHQRFEKLREEIEDDQEEEQRPNLRDKRIMNPSVAADYAANLRSQNHQKRERKYQRKQYAEQPIKKVEEDSSLKKQSSQKSQKIDKDNPPEYLMCPITQALMVSPVILATCGHTFEETVIRDWLKKQLQCPLCKRQSNENAIIKNFALADALNNFK